MSDLTHTSYYRALQAPFSEALEIVRIATDAMIEHHGEAYPPILTAAEFAGHLATRSDFIDYNIGESPQDQARKQDDLTKKVKVRLLHWTGEEFFEQVPIPVTTEDDVPVTEFGFQITDRGMRVADSPLRDHGISLIRNADRIVRHRLTD